MNHRLPLTLTANKSDGDVIMALVARIAVGSALISAKVWANILLDCAERYGAKSNRKDSGWYRTTEDK